MAAQLGNALIAPVIQYVPEGQATLENPATISCRDACFENVVAAGARSLKAGGFKEILLIGDNGGNQGSLTKVADELNKEWAGSDTKVYALTDYYEQGHTSLEQYLMGVYGWSLDQIGSHAGIQDTSQMEWVKPYDVRMDQIAHSFADKEGSSVSGDPTKSTPEFGRVAIDFKANGALAQYRQMKAPPRGRTQGR
jgi:creatinine amidohydrolase/Fe(II)-dependent formamide hydrolase-like protein